MPEARGSTRILHQPEGRIVTVGLRRSSFRDLYHVLLTSSWSSLFALVIVVYLGANALFAAAYMALGDAIDNARPGSFTDDFFFSVQTMATIGYGRMAPRTIPANILVTLEAMTGMLSVAVVTGLIFTKFARPTARVLFSRVAVVGPLERVPALSFRIANERPNPIVDAQLSVMLVLNETTAEGDVVRRVHDLPLRRSHSALFGLTWTVAHAIGRDSPLYGLSEAALDQREAELVVSMTGFEESLSQTVHAHHVYRSMDIVWGAQLAELLVRRRRRGVRALDFRRFHEAVPVEPQHRTPSEHPSLRRP